MFITNWKGYINSSINLLIIVRHDIMIMRGVKLKIAIN